MAILFRVQSPKRHDFRQQAFEVKELLQKKMTDGVEKEQGHTHTHSHPHAQSLYQCVHNRAKKVRAFSLPFAPHWCNVPCLPSDGFCGWSGVHTGSPPPPSCCERIRVKPDPSWQLSLSISLPSRRPHAPAPKPHALSFLQQITFVKQTANVSLQQINRKHIFCFASDLAGCLNLLLLWT